MSYMRLWIVECSFLTHATVTVCKFYFDIIIGVYFICLCNDYLIFAKRIWWNNLEQYSVKYRNYSVFDFLGVRVQGGGAENVCHNGGGGGPNQRHLRSLLFYTLLWLKKYKALSHTDGEKRACFSINSKAFKLSYDDFCHTLFATQCFMKLALLGPTTISRYHLGPYKEQRQL